jgi:hypothetical protein
VLILPSLLFACLVLIVGFGICYIISLQDSWGLFSGIPGPSSEKEVPWLKTHTLTTVM